MNPPDDGLDALFGDPGPAAVLPPVVDRVAELEERVQELESQVANGVVQPDPNAPRHRAATLLAWLFSAAFLLLIAAEMVSAVFHGIETTDTLTTLMLTTGSLLVGVTGAYLSRNLNRPPDARVELESKVGLILATTLGGMLLILAVTDVWEVVKGTESAGLSDNALNVFAVLLSGIIGALGGYLGFARRPEDDTAPKSKK